MRAQLRSARALPLIIGCFFLSQLSAAAQCSGSAVTTAVTASDQTMADATSRQIVAGNGTTVNLSTPGQLSIDVGNSSSAATYIGCNPLYVVPATPGELISIYGSATKVVKIQRIRIMTEQTTAGGNFLFLYRRNNTASGGTANAVTPVRCDQNDLPPSATMVYYTANPSGLSNSDPKIMDGTDVQAPAAASNIQPNWNVIYDARYDGKALILRGTNQGIGLNFNGAALPSGFKVQLQIIWTEE